MTIREGAIYLLTVYSTNLSLKKAQNASDLVVCLPLGSFLRLIGSTSVPPSLLSVLCSSTDKITRCKTLVLFVSEGIIIQYSASASE